jgi:quinol monooxygenase YgiN
MKMLTMEAYAMREFSIVAVLTIREGTEDEMRAALAARVSPSRQDPGNLRYELYADRTEPRRFVIGERWTDEAAHVKHDQESAHIRQFTKHYGDKIAKADVYRLESMG